MLKFISIWLRLLNILKNIRNSISTLNFYMSDSVKLYIKAEGVNYIKMIKIMKDGFYISERIIKHIKIY